LKRPRDRGATQPGGLPSKQGTRWHHTTVRKVIGAAGLVRGPSEGVLLRFA
jgi:hypothetical protein